jgi:hypothetical protein
VGDHEATSGDRREDLPSVEVVAAGASDHPASSRALRRQRLSRWAAGGEIPLLPRILQVVDIYDALRTARPYKPALGHEQAALTMRAEARSGLWDQELVAEFFGMLDQRRQVA